MPTLPPRSYSRSSFFETPASDYVPYLRHRHSVLRDECEESHPWQPPYVKDCSHYRAKVTGGNICGVHKITLPAEDCLLDTSKEPYNVYYGEDNYVIPIQPDILRNAGRRTTSKLRPRTSTPDPGKITTRIRSTLPTRTQLSWRTSTRGRTATKPMKKKKDQIKIWTLANGGREMRTTTLGTTKITSRKKEKGKTESPKKNGRKERPKWK